LSEGVKKYAVALGFSICHLYFSNISENELFKQNDFSLLICLNGPDFNYNFMGLIGRVDVDDSMIKTIRQEVYVFQKYNRAIRFPVFATGVGLVSKLGVDLFHYVVNGEPIDPSSWSSAEYGIGLLALASSMYIKEIDPKLLDKKPFWKSAYEWIKERIASLSPKPVPVPVQTYASLDDSVDLL